MDIDGTVCAGFGLVSFSVVVCADVRGGLPWAGPQPGAGLITAAVTAIPHMLASTFTKQQSALVIIGSASAGQQPSGAGSARLGAVSGGSQEVCPLEGVYVVPERVQLRNGTITDADVASLVSIAGDADETGGSYLLQASSGQTVVLTGIHTVLLRWVPADSIASTKVTVVTGCAGATPPKYVASIDLDAANVTPKLSLVDPAGGTSTPITDPTQVVTQDEPLKIDFTATTSKYDVTWELRFDYVVNGHAESSVIPSSGEGFQTDEFPPVAGRRCGPGQG
jgi:hypothetical protein